METPQSNSATNQQVADSNRVDDTITNEMIEGADTQIAVVDRPSNSYFRELGSQSNQLDITNFLKRPYIHATGILNAASAGSIQTLILPESIVSHSAYADKLIGYAGFRATTNIRLRVNATKFQAGLLVMAFYPQLQHKAVAYETSYEWLQLPHVMLDLSVDTEAVLRVPHISNLPYYDRIKGTGGVGIVKLWVYSPLATGLGSTTANYSIWVNFDDIDLQIPVAQGTIAEMEQKQQGPVAVGLSKVTKTAKLISKIPVLSSFAAPVGWAADIARSVANVWGWSIPLNVNDFARMNMIESAYDTNADGTENARSLALYSSPCVTVDPALFGTTEDEMTISSIVQRRGYIRSFEWSLDNPYGTELFTIDLAPDIMYASATANKVVGPTPVQYVNNMFTMYRGSLVFTFRIVKTQFHSGRLLFAYKIGASNGVAPDLTFGEIEFLPKDIVDVRDCTEYVFTCPYASTKGYSLQKDAYGTLSVFVLEPLVAPDTVNSTIQLHVEVAAAPDFEVAIPSRGYMAPYAITNTEFIATAQGDMGCLSPKGLGGIPVNSGDPTFSSLCVGEKILSLKQLCNRTSELSGKVTPALTSVKGGYRYFVSPHTLFATYAGLPAAETAIATDILSVVGALFNYTRGGVILRVRTSNCSGDTQIACVNVDNITNNSFPIVFFRDTYVTTDDTLNLTRNRTGNLFPKTDNTHASILIPQYNSSISRLNAPTKVNDAENVNFFSGTLVDYAMPIQAAVHVITTPQVSSVTNVAITLLRQAAEDFHYGMFLCAPNYRRTIAAT